MLCATPSSLQKRHLFTQEIAKVRDGVAHEQTDAETVLMWGSIAVKRAGQQQRALAEIGDAGPTTLRPTPQGALEHGSSEHLAKLAKQSTWDHWIWATLGKSCLDKATESLRLHADTRAMLPP